MANFIIIALLCIIIYLLLCYALFPTGAQQRSERMEESQVHGHSQVSDDDIMGKSTFDVNAELQRIRQAKEEAARREGFAKGEVTEDGKEIAQEVKPEDCETESKRIWEQVPSDELDSMFDETDEPGEPHAEGATINDIDLAFDNLGRKNLTEEEARQTVKVLKELEGTEFLDAVEQQFSEVGVRIDELIDRFAARQGVEVTVPKSFEEFKLSDFL